MVESLIPSLIYQKFTYMYIWASLVIMATITAVSPHIVLPKCQLLRSARTYIKSPNLKQLYESVTTKIKSIISLDSTLEYVAKTIPSTYRKMF